jgi:gliding motility-associated-like protein
MLTNFTIFTSKFLLKSKRMKLLRALIILFSVPSIVFAQHNSNARAIEFIANKAQWPMQVNYRADIPFGHIYFTKNAFRFVHFSDVDLETAHEAKHGEDYMQAYTTPIRMYAYDVQFINASNAVEISNNKKRNNYYNFILGNDANKWAGNVPAYEQLTYNNMYNGIDVNIYSEEGAFKYDVIVKPGAKLSELKMAYKGITPTIKDGKVILNLGFKTIAEAIPYTYQIINGKKQDVACKYIINTDGTISFELPNGYNKNETLIIDPILIFSTYSGTSATTYGFSATYDAAGSLYAGGEVFSSGWPASTGAFQTTYSSGVDAGINKYTPNGNALIYSTYYGGSGSDLPNNLVVNSNNELAMMGSTSSSNLPVPAGCYDNTLGGTLDAYVVHFNAAGSALVGATYIGGSGIDASANTGGNYGDNARGEIFFDNNNDIVVVASTNSTDWPVTVGAYQAAFQGGGQDGTFFKLNTTCTTLLQSTYIGGNGDDACFSVVKNSLGNWVIAGGTESTNFPTTTGAWQTSYNGSTDGFVIILNNLTSGIVNGSYIGTTVYDHAFKVQIESADTVYLCGITASGSSFPVSPGTYNVPNSTVYFLKMYPDLSNYALSTRIGQSANLVPTAFLKDNCGNVYFSGFQAGSSLTVTPTAHQTTQGGFWLAVLSGDFTSLLYATYMGAVGDHCDGGTSRFDPLGIVYQSVCTSSTSNYGSTGAYATTKNGSASWDVASFKFDFQYAGASAILDISPNDSGCAPYPVNFSNNGSAGTNFLWYFGDGDTSTLPNPVHTYTTAGTYVAAMIAFNLTGCIPTDTAYTTIRVLPAVDANFNGKVGLGCIDDTIAFTLTSTSIPPNTLVSWDFGDGFTSTSFNPTHVYTTQGTYTVKCYMANLICKDTVVKVFNLTHPIDAQFITTVNNTPEDSICLGETFKIIAVGSIPQGYLDYDWKLGDGTITSTTGTVNTINHTYANSGIYTISLKVTDSLGCVDSITNKVFIDEPPYLNFTVSDNDLCVGEALYILDTLAPQTIAFNYKYGDGTVQWNTNNPSFAYENSGNYNITLTGFYLVCDSISKTIPVTVNDYPAPNLGPDTSFCDGLTGPIVLNPQDFAQQYNWSTGVSTQSATITKAGTYFVTLKNGDCATADTIDVKNDCYINIPNSFTPDNDGLNDYWIPMDILSAGVTKFELNIYNRWGEQIFNTTNTQTRGWDGNFGGKAQPLGVYIYAIDVTYKNTTKKSFKGNLTLLR